MFTKKTKHPLRTVCLLSCLVEEPNFSGNSQDFNRIRNVLISKAQNWTQPTVTSRWLHFTSLVNINRVSHPYCSAMKPLALRNFHVSALLAPKFLNRAFNWDSWRASSPVWDCSLYLHVIYVGQVAAMQELGPCDWLSQGVPCKPRLFGNASVDCKHGSVGRDGPLRCAAPCNLTWMATLRAETLEVLAVSEHTDWHLFSKETCYSSRRRM